MEKLCLLLWPVPFFCAAFFQCFSIHIYIYSIIYSIYTYVRKHIYIEVSYIVCTIIVLTCKYYDRSMIKWKYRAIVVRG